ncbi:hypothetical protein PUN28_004772 [Cardiocondyla obscurior]|uniref:Uncharacterized protein n=1 Tax=Cardiocondyla obscurior TaxID=286306 RepID=A0AAW2GHI2_9HYME
MVIAEFNQMACRENKIISFQKILLTYNIRFPQLHYSLRARKNYDTVTADKCPTLYFRSRRENAIICKRSATTGRYWPNNDPAFRLIGNKFVRSTGGYKALSVNLGGGQDNARSRLRVRSLPTVALPSFLGLSSVPSPLSMIPTSHPSGVTSLRRETIVFRRTP